MASATFAPSALHVESLRDGSMVLRSTAALAEHPPTVVHSFRAGSEDHPDRVLIADRTGDGWRTRTWGELRRDADRLAQGMLDRGLAERPVMVLSGSTSEHLTVTLAAHTLGVPIVPASVAYSLQSADHAKLKAMVEVADPGMIFAQDGEFAAALAAIGTGRVVVTAAGDVPGSVSLVELSAEPTSAVEGWLAAVTGDTIAKIMFTSGSTGAPKGVINTHEMLSANQQQMRQVWPFLTEEPPVLLDWLPWSHTFGGNHNLNMVLTNGGSLWVDDGRPAPGMIEKTVRNLRDVQPTVYFNVPAGYAALVPILEREWEAAELFFRNLRLGFFAAAALPQQLWERIQKLATEHGSTMQMTTSWGLTETSPASTTTHFPIRESNNIGVPLPGVEIKLVPVAGKTELRVRGPNVTPGFYRRPDLTQEAFDRDGYLLTGDAVRLADPEDLAAGLVFDGRIAEDFKLMTGTFVSVGTLRPALLSAAQGLLSDAVICGHDGDCVTALVWLHGDHAGRCSTDGIPDDNLRTELVEVMQRLAEAGGGSSRRIERMLILTAPPGLDLGEITDKGYINQRVVRERRSAEVHALCGTDDPRLIVRQG